MYTTQYTYHYFEITNIFDFNIAFTTEITQANW